mgnify:CR=1 FL=1
MRTAPLIPVLVLGDRLDPAALAETLVGAGLPVIEVTLRTTSALDAIADKFGKDAIAPADLLGHRVEDDEDDEARRKMGSARFDRNAGSVDPG